MGNYAFQGKRRVAGVAMCSGSSYVRRATETSKAGRPGEWAVGEQGEHIPARESLAVLSAKSE
jgi:hypothetical protein